MNTSCRSGLANFLHGVAPIWLETGRYGKISVKERVCPLYATT